MEVVNNFVSPAAASCPATRLFEIIVKQIFHAAYARSLGRRKRIKNGSLSKTL